MDRLQDGYRHRFRTLLARVHPRRLEFGVELLLGRARERSLKEGVPLPRAFADVYEFTRVRVDRRVALMAACTVEPAPTKPAPGPNALLCDASLGGLARWLRAAGYDASVPAGLRGDALLSEARSRGAVLLTSDSRLIARRAVREGAVTAVWIPSALTCLEQLAMAARDLGLVLREPRCMACGGSLKSVEKDAVRDRIPPRTALWKDKYFLCATCDRLYWQGTHWERIAAALRGVWP